MKNRDRYLATAAISVFVVAIIGGALSFVPKQTLAKWMPHGSHDATSMHQTATTGQAKH